MASLPHGRGESRRRPGLIGNPCPTIRRRPDVNESGRLLLMVGATTIRPCLPPTPIAMPGADAIRAAVHPEEGKDLYFVARGDGGHKFSATLKEHNAAVRKYQLRRKGK